MFEAIASPWDQDDPMFPVDWGASWVRGSHREGRARARAVAEIQERLAGVGVLATVIVGGPWIAGDYTRGVWRVGPWPADAPQERQLWAEGAGEADPAWVTALVDAFLAAHPEPDTAPRLFRYDEGLVLDTAMSGRRSGLVIFRMGPLALPFVEELAPHRATWWVALMISGLLRADWFWAHWDEVAELLVDRPSHGSWSPDRPVNPQEVTLRVAEVARVWAERSAATFEVAAVGIFLPDPDDEYVYCLAGAGMTPYAYDAGLVGKPTVDGVGYGLTAAWAVGPAWDAAGGPVVVRELADRAALWDRYRDLGFDEEEIAADGREPSGPFLAERFVDPDRVDAARRGPWVFTAQRLPQTLSPSGRNLVVRLAGRTLPGTWHSPSELARTSRDRRARIAMLSMRIHDDVVRLFHDGLDLWRQGLRDEVLRELEGPRRWAAVCQTLASWTSARAVSLFTYGDGELRLLAWSLPRPAPAIRLDAADRLDSRELRLLHAPLYPTRQQVGGEGFLGWPTLEEALGAASENVGTVPLVRGGRPVGLLRIDGAMSLLAGHLPRRSAHGALHHHRPTVTPAHVRPVLEEVARLVALVLEGPAVVEEAWGSWVARVVAGGVAPDQARARLQALHARAPSRGEAASAVGVHRNTFRRHLLQLEAVLGAVPWT